jgi:hypothetical protein
MCRGPLVVGVLRMDIDLAGDRLRTGIRDLQHLVATHDDAPGYS